MAHASRSALNNVSLSPHLLQVSKLSYFHSFSTSVDSIELPENFTFPFYYEPHPLAQIAAEELKVYLKNQGDFRHNFGLSKDDTGLVIGKMFGVLVVQNSAGELGYLCAFSGKLANSNHHPHFVPPVYDILESGSFFVKEEQEIDQITQKIKAIENSKEFQESLISKKESLGQMQIEVQEFKQQIKKNKALRDERRKQIEELSDLNTRENELEALRKQSVGEQLALKKLQSNWRIKLAEVEASHQHFVDTIELLKEKRAAWSADLQARIFDCYTFLNAGGKQKSLQAIFSNAIIAKITGGKPPAGAGECAAPKLLQYAFQNELKPICMAEFWWGESPKSEVRIHEHYYPACRGKCEPILGHMLSETKIDPNPLLHVSGEEKEVSIVYEDSDIVVINKPAEFLSVPGKNISDSVLTRIQAQFPKAAGPLIVHRLDMSTSGLMVLALHMEAYKSLQHQFVRRKVVKRYEAILDGIIDELHGEITLPLRVDVEDRPRQVVCFEHGKHAFTTWEKVAEVNGKTIVYFYPHTGRTHQLRVHAAHPQGLHTPIVGDDLYGKRADRLYLHAGFLQFEHPMTRKLIAFELKAEF